MDWVELVEGTTYDLLVKNVNFNSSGTYKCDYLTANVYSMQAELMTLGKIEKSWASGTSEISEFYSTLYFSSASFSESSRALNQSEAHRPFLDWLLALVG